MADQNGAGIAWTDETWNPVRGCSRISEGCRYCYAERTAARFIGKGQPYEGLAKQTAAGPRWTGKVRLVEKHLEDPLRWTRPRKIFVNSMSDLFHEALADDDILRIFDVMRRAHDRGHVFQVLTKRAKRMRAFVSELDFDATGAGKMLLRDRGLTRYGTPISFMPCMKDVWLGVSVEDQDAADERVPELLETPAAVRWLSVEPQIGPVDLSKFLKWQLLTNAGELLTQPDPRIPGTGGKWLRPIDWVVIGGESGPGARPFDLKWARDLVEQCEAAGVACFVKQLGAVPIMEELTWRAGPGSVLWGGKKPEPGWVLSATTRHLVPQGFVGLKFTGKGGDPGEWPADLRVREYPMAGGTPP